MHRGWRGRRVPGARAPRPWHPLARAGRPAAAGSTGAARSRSGDSPARRAGRPRPHRSMRRLHPTRFWSSSSSENRRSTARRRRSARIRRRRRMTVRRAGRGRSPVGGQCRPHRLCARDRRGPNRPAQEGSDPPGIRAGRRVRGRHRPCPPDHPRPAWPRRSASAPARASRHRAARAQGSTQRAGSEPQQRRRRRDASSIVSDDQL